MSKIQTICLCIMALCTLAIVFSFWWRGKVKANDSSIHNSVDRMRRSGRAWYCIYIIKDWGIFSRYI
jgi:hypothetical protein